MPGEAAIAAVQSRIELLELPIAPETVARARGPLVEVTLGPKGLPVAATAAAAVDASAAAVFRVLSDVESFAERIPLLHRVRLDGDVAELSLRLKVAFFGVTFSFKSEVEAVEGRSLSLRYLEGEPRDILIRWEIAPHPDGDADRCLLFVHIGFEIESLGWLVKLFLRHHPEIQYGVFSGCALALLESMRANPS